jgi:hypothetical protein
LEVVLVDFVLHRGHAERSGVIEAFEQTATAKQSGVGVQPFDFAGSDVVDAAEQFGSRGRRTGPSVEVDRSYQRCLAWMWEGFPGDGVFR